MNFTKIESIETVKSAVLHKKEILWYSPLDTIVCACYIIQDKDTFDSPESLECRGIAFNSSTGTVASRPLHKFFNVGERGYTVENLLNHDPADIAGIYPKLDGSLIATCTKDDETILRSKKSFDGEHVQLAWDCLRDTKLVSGNLVLTKTTFKYQEFFSYLKDINATAIFELIHPDNRIVVNYAGNPSLVLLHVRDNVSGEYLLLDPNHQLHAAIFNCRVPRVSPIAYSSMKELINSLDTMENAEGYVIQFKNGNMVKLKCPWYLKMHRAVSMLRERDIAELILSEQIDDSKKCLTALGISLDQIHEIENKIKKDILEILGTVELIYSNDHLLSRKDFAIKYKGCEYFSLLMKKYSGAEIDYKGWYRKNKLEKNFSLKNISKSPQIPDKSDRMFIEVSAE